MGRKRNSVGSVQLTISTTEHILVYLEQLVAGGLFGKNPAEAAERLVARGIEGLMRDGSLPGCVKAPAESNDESP
jgi:hypothetical protein